MVYFNLNSGRCRQEYDVTDEEGIKSIPYQLQKLFLQLQVISYISKIDCQLYNL